MTCTLCPLHESAITVCVPGRGPEQCDIMIVGQNPGSREDMLGQPFIGPAGKMLDGILADAGYDPQGVYISNAVKCRTPNDRPPMPGEVEACRAHLKQEITQRKPGVIIALGDVALRSLCKTSGIRDKRGQSFPLHAEFSHNCEVWPTYHPAFVLRSPQARNVVVSDLRRVRDRAKEQESIPWRDWDGLFEFGEAVSLDLEAIGADGKYTDYPTQAAIYSNAHGVACVFRDDDLQHLQHDLNAPSLQLQMVLTRIQEAGVLLVTHNGWDYDLHKLREYGFKFARWGRDTMVLAYLDDETQPLGLEALCVKYLGVRGWKEDRDAPFGSDRLAEYNARDAMYTVRLYEKLMETLGTNPAGVHRSRIADEIILPARIALNECTRRGIWIDESEVRKVEAEQNVAAQKHRARLGEIVGDPKFNPNSSMQVGKYLRAQGIALPETPTGKDSTGAAVIKRLADESSELPEDLQDTAHEFLKTLIDYRKATKTLSTYVKPYLKAATSEDGRIHPNYTVIRTVVGRTSSNDPNAQNLDRKLKAFLSAPPGFAFANADYSALHFRLAAWCAQEQTIIKRYRDNPLWDPHLFFAFRFYDSSMLTDDEKLWGENEAKAFLKKYPAWKDKRQIAKSANFSQLYMGMGDTLRNYAAKMGIMLEDYECDQIHRAWHRTFPGFRQWYVSVKEFLLAHGYVETPVGRRRHFGDPDTLRSLNRYAFAAALREAVNFHVLGLEPDIALPGLSYCMRAGLPVNYFCHDSVGAELPDNCDRAQIEQTFRECMIDKPLQLLRDRFGVDMNVPLEIEVTWGKAA